ncbi:hypothetical protein ABE530_05840 [Brucella sp. TWI559]
MKMDERMRFFWMIAIPVSVVAVMLVIMTGSKCALPDATATGDRCGNPFSNWLYDFQSLIAGTFAVVAAVATIRQMAKADAFEEQRQKKAIAFALRREKSVADSFSRFTSAQSFATSASIALLFDTVGKRNNYMWTYAERQLFWVAVETCYELETTLAHEVVDRATEFMPADVYFPLNEAQSRLKELRNKIPDISSTVDFYTNSDCLPSRYDHEIEFILSEIQSNSLRLNRSIVSWKDSIIAVQE